MSENDLDGGQSEGTTQNTNSGLSNGKGDKQLSNDASKLQATLDSLVSKVGELDARYKTMQEGKDKGISNTKKEVDDLKRKFAEIEKLKKSGLDEDGAIEELTFRDEIRAVREQLSKLNPTQSQPTGNGERLAAEEAKALVKELQLDLNDQKVAEAYGKNDIVGLAKLAVSRQSPAPTAADAPPPSGTLQRSPDAEELTQLYKNEMQAARGKPTALRAIKDKYVKQGVKVHEVDFT